MHRIFLWQAVICLLFFCAPYSFAQTVVLNEIFANPENEDDEFVELFNNSDSEVDLRDWKITDLVKSYSITDSKISPKSFIVFEKSTTSIALNNSSETVSLIDNLGNTIDSFSYEETIESTSWSRVPDGTGSFSNNTSVTKGSNNAIPPTPTPLPTATPTKTPTPTRTPTPVKSIELSKKAEDEDGFTIAQQGERPTPTEKIQKTRTMNPTLHQSVSGVSDVDEGTDVVSNSENKNKKAPTYLYSFTTGLGMLVLGCGILLYKKFKARKEDIDDF